MAINLDEINLWDYERAPEQDYFEENQYDAELVEDSINIEPIPLPIAWLYSKVSTKKVASLSPWLQRYLLERVWQANGWSKSKSYVKDLWKGLGQMTPFLFVPIDLLIENINYEISTETREEVKAQFLEIKEELEQKKHNGVELINLDGQTRQNVSIIPYLESAYTLSSDDEGAAINVLNNKGQYEDISNKFFKELDEYQRGGFLSKTILCTFMTSGDLNDITNALISINSNEKWKEWQEIYNGRHFSTYTKRIHQIIGLEDDEYVKNWFNTYVRKNKYKPEYSGWEQYVAERMYFLAFHSVPSMADLKKAFIKQGLEVPSMEVTARTKGWIMELCDNYKGESIEPGVIDGYIFLRDIIDCLHTKEAKSDWYYKIFNVQKFIVLNKSEFVKWYIQKDIDLRSEYINGVLNTKSFTELDNGDIEVLEHGYAGHCAGGFKENSLRDRLKMLLEELNNDFNTLLSKRVISKVTSMPSMKKVMANSGFKTITGKLIDPTKQNKLDKGHKNAKAKGGSYEVSNLAPQSSKANRQNKARDLASVSSKKKK